MLQSIRDHTQGWIAGIIVSLLVLSFALWGIHSYLGGGSSNTFVAKVNGTEITKSQMAATYERLRRQLQIELHSTYTLPEGAEAKLKDRALQMLISVQVLKEASLNQGYRVSFSQIDNFLMNIPEFQVNGQFSRARFQQSLANTMFSPNDFWELLKTSLLIDQPRLGMIFTSFALPEEVNATYALFNQQRDIRYAFIPVEFFQKQIADISNEKILAYYKEHQDEFKTAEQVSVEYIILSAKDLEKMSHPSDQILQKFYNDNASSFTQLDKNKNPQVLPYASVKEKVKEAYARQEAVEKFAELREKLANLAYEHPDSLQFASKELNLPINRSALFTHENGKDISANPKIREAAFSEDVLNQKNNSDLIQLDSENAVVLRIVSHVPAASLSLKEVEKNIIEKIKIAEAETRSSQWINDITQKLQQSNNPDLVANQNHINWVNAGFVSRSDAKLDPAIFQAAFSAPKPKNNKPSFASVKLQKGYAIVALQSVRDGVLNNKDQTFADQVQASEGLLEYELYKQSLMKQAKIEIENPE